MAITNERRDVSDFRRRRQRDSSIFLALVWVALVYFWAAKIFQEGFRPGDALLGWAIVGMLGLIGLTSPPLPDPYDRAAKAGGAAVLAGAFVAMYFF